MAVTQMHGKTFDRVPQWDDRNSDYLLRAVSPESVSKTPPAEVSHTRVIFLDQGQEGGCVGYSNAQVMSLPPHVRKDITSSFAEFSYFEAKQYDEFKGDNYQGSSVLGNQKSMLANKYNSAYNWCVDVADIIAALAFHGPVQIGINWYESMFTVDPKTGIITIDSGSALAGGHALCVNGYKGNGELFRLDNTWGKSWGQSGSAWLSATDLARLMTEDGEAAIPTKLATLPSPLGSHARVDPGT